MVSGGQGRRGEGGSLVSARGPSDSREQNGNRERKFGRPRPFSGATAT